LSSLPALIAELHQMICLHLLFWREGKRWKQIIEECVADWKEEKKEKSVGGASSSSIFQP
jgi:hypothetical protein